MGKGGLGRRLGVTEGTVVGRALTVPRAPKQVEGGVTELPGDAPLRQVPGVEARQGGRDPLPLGGCWRQRCRITWTLGTTGKAQCPSSSCPIQLGWACKVNGRVILRKGT